jgi:hypothetical protein
MLKKMYWNIAEYFALRWFEKLRIKSFKVAGLDFTTEVVYDENGKYECLVVDDEDDFTEDNFIDYGLSDMTHNGKYTPTYLYNVMFEIPFSDDESQVYDLFVEAFNKEDAELLVMEDLMLKGFDGYTILSVDEYKNFMPYFNTPPFEDRGWK